MTVVRVSTKHEVLLVAEQAQDEASVELIYDVDLGKIIVIVGVAGYGGSITIELEDFQNWMRLIISEMR